MKRILLLGALVVGTVLVVMYAGAWRTSRREPAPPIAPPKTVQVAIQSLGYTPADISVSVGDTVEWVNHDVFPHTATAKNGAWTVVIPANASASLVMQTEGAFDYYCQYHPNMTARVVVRPRV